MSTHSLHTVQVSLEDDPAWRTFLSSLQQRGQFGGAAEGSDAYRRLLTEAQQAFQKWAAYERTTVELAAPASCVDALLQVRSLRPANHTLSSLGQPLLMLSLTGTAIGRSSTARAGVLICQHDTC
jgi:hypothetical protein